MSDKFYRGEPSGLFRRFCACFLDGLIFSFLMLVLLGTLLVAGLLVLPEVHAVVAVQKGAAAEQSLVDGLIAEHAAALIASAIGIILWGVITMLFEGSRMHSTPGKYILGLRVVRVMDNVGVGYGASFWRYVLLALLGALYGLGVIANLILMLTTEKKQGFHDMIMGTYVIRIKS